MTQRPLRLAIPLACVIAAALSAAPAQAGTFRLRSCMAARGEGYDSAAFAGARSSARMTIKRACNPFGHGTRGLVTANKVTRRRLRRNERATVVLSAPPGTRITGFKWSGGVRRADCGFTVELYAVRPGRPRSYIRRESAGRDCPNPRKTTASYRPARPYSIGSATAIVQRVICRSKRGCSASRLNMLVTRYAAATIWDPVRPRVQVIGGGLASRRWVRGEQAVRFAASDNVGVRDARLFVEGRQFARAAPPCRYSRRIPCPSGPGALTINTARISGDGPRPMAVVVQDAAGNVNFAQLLALVDNNPPARVEPRVAGGEGWRRTNSFFVSWSAAAERFAPITAAFTRICPTGGAGCKRTRHVRSRITSVGGLRVPGPGDWSLSVWRQDAAGNASESLASVPVHLRYDPEPPRLAFEAQSVADPTRISVRVAERFSGLATGAIELRRQGTATWHTLPTRPERDRLVARIDDSRFPPGVYQLRSLARDRAGNESSTTARVDGSQMLLRVPLRFETRMTAGFVRSRVIRKRIRRGGRRKIVRRRVKRLIPTARLRFGRRARIGGRLTNLDGQPIANATVYVYSRSLVEPDHLVGAVTTSSSGRFSYLARGTSTRTLRLVYVGTSLALPALREVTMRVPSTSTIRQSRRRARNGHSVTFRGRIRSQPLPTSGKLVEIQAHFRGRWRTFSTVRAAGDGRWKFRYRFGGTIGKVRYRFRALLPAEAGYPFETGRSRTVSVTVRGP